MMVSGTAKSAKNWTDFFWKFCENYMLRNGNSGLKMVVSRAAHIPNMHTYGSTPPRGGGGDTASKSDHENKSRKLKKNETLSTEWMESCPQLASMRSDTLELKYFIAWRGGGGEGGIPPPSHRRCTYAHSPSLEPPYLGKRIYPLSRVLVTIGNYKKHPLFRVLLGNLHETTAKKYPPFPRKWEYACGPSCIRVGGGGGALGSYYVHISTTSSLKAW